MISKVETPKNNLTLEDLAVGQKFFSDSYLIDADQIKVFARQFDPQPFHTDEATAKGTFFGELVASGWQTAAITMRLLVGSAPILGGLIGAGGEISWPRATKPGDTLQVETEVIDVKASRSRPDRGIATVRSITRNQHGDAVQILTSRLVVPTRAAANSNP